MLRHSLVAFVSFITLAGCATTAPPHARQAEESPVPLNVHWYRDSAEQKAVYIETYRTAAAAARSLSRGLADRSWGVILDIDETILDNSDYEKKVRGVFDAKLWDQWIDQRAATVLPGAKEFIDTVRSELHGVTMNPLTPYRDLFERKAASYCALAVARDLQWLRQRPRAWEG